MKLVIVDSAFCNHLLCIFAFCVTQLCEHDPLQSMFKYRFEHGICLRSRNVVVTMTSYYVFPIHSQYSLFCTMGCRLDDKE